MADKRRTRDKSADTTRSPRAQDKSPEPKPQQTWRLATPGRSGPASVLQLQRAIGNRAAASMLDAAGRTGPPAASLQRRGGAGGFVLDEQTAAQIRRARGGGQALSGPVRETMNSALGYHFDRVRVHTGSEADRLNRRLGSRAFAAGPDIYFRRGAYDPASPRGRELLAHELHHVVQQGTGRVKGTGGGITVRPAGDPLEREADIFARRAVSGFLADRGDRRAVQAGNDGSRRHASEPRDIQRNGDPPSGGGPAAKEPTGAEKAVLSKAQMKKQKTEIDLQVKELPVPELPTEAEIRKKEEQGKALGEELAPIVKISPEVAEFVHADLMQGASGGGAAPAGPAPESAAGAQKMPKFARQGSFKQEGRAAARAGRRDVGAAAGEMFGWAEQAAEIGVEAASVGGKIVAAGKAAAEVAGKVLGAIGAFFAAISAYLDIRAIFSSQKKARALKEVLAEARSKADAEFQDVDAGQKEELFEAIEYAIEQKYTKVFRRALALTGTLLSTGVGVAALIAGVSLLASNPVGWMVAAGIFGFGIGLGVGLLLCKIGRWIWKKFKGTKGKKRKEMAEKLCRHASDGPLQALALQALASLGLNWEDIKADKKRVDLVARKLQSS